MRRFRFDSLRSVRPGSLLELDHAESNHLFKILRASAGDSLQLLDGHGGIGSAVVEPGRLVRLTDVEFVPEPVRKLHLYLAPPRKQKMDQILKQIVELGVWRIVPILCERSVSQPDADSVSGRWTDLLFEACKQSGNPYLPETASPMRFPEALEDARTHCVRIYSGSPREDSELSRTSSDTMGFFVGPEGGFTEAEEARMKELGIRPLRIGDWTLRVETAVIAGVSVLMRG